ncbi:hypothetical protein [Streptosporangium carneum]|nr:hypothetical protein [Streptosporangium carneum]
MSEVNPAPAGSAAFDALGVAEAEPAGIARPRPAELMGGAA